MDVLSDFGYISQKCHANDAYGVVPHTLGYTPVQKNRKTRGKNWRSSENEFSLNTNFRSLKVPEFFL
jgi:hypothetical protein